MDGALMYVCLITSDSVVMCLALHVVEITHHVVEITHHVVEITHHVR